MYPAPPIAVSRSSSDAARARRSRAVPTASRIWSARLGAGLPELLESGVLERRPGRLRERFVRGPPVPPAGNQASRKPLEPGGVLPELLLVPVQRLHVAAAAAGIAASCARSAACSSIAASRRRRAASSSPRSFASSSASSSALCGGSPGRLAHAPPAASSRPSIAATQRSSRAWLSSRSSAAVARLAPSCTRVRWVPAPSASIASPAPRSARSASVRGA